MPRYLLDTDHLTLLQHRHPLLVGRLNAQKPGDVAVSVVTVEEVLRGRFAVLARLRSGPPLIQAYDEFQESFDFLVPIPREPFDAAADQIFRQLLAQKLRVGTMDLRIAAVALARNLTLLTRNTRDFARVPGLQLDDWSL